MKKILLVLALVSCTSAEEVLEAKGRPLPIDCVKTANSQMTCTDGIGVVWTCYTGDFKASCIATGQLLKEIP